MTTLEAHKRFNVMVNENISVNEYIQKRSARDKQLRAPRYIHPSLQVRSVTSLYVASLLKPAATLRQTCGVVISPTTKRHPMASKLASFSRYLFVGQNKRGRLDNHNTCNHRFTFSYCLLEKKVFNRPMYLFKVRLHLTSIQWERIHSSTCANDVSSMGWSGRKWRVFFSAKAKTDTAVDTLFSPLSPF